MPDDIKELFRYDVAKAKKLLAEAGLPNGFTFKVQVCACSPVGMELLALARRLLRTDQGQARRPGHGVWRASFGDEQQYQRAGLSSTRSAWRTRSRRHGSTSSATPTIPRSSTTRPLPQKFADAAQRTRRGEAACDVPRHGARCSSRRAVRLPARAALLLGLVAVGEELQRRTARRRRRPGPIYARLWIDQDLKKRMGY